jgi:3-oxoadipate enol-lactonase
VTNWLLLHGTPLGPAIWNGVLPLLEGDVAVPAITPGADAAVRGQQHVIARRLSEGNPEGEPPWHVVGHSYGGQVALELAIQAAQLVSELTLLCTRDTPYPPFAAAADRIAAEPVPDDETLARWFSPSQLSADGPVVQQVRAMLQDADRTAWSRAVGAIAAFDCSGQTSSIRCPTKIVAAAHDAVSTPEAMNAMHSRLPGSEFVVLDDAWHMSIFTDPARLAGLLGG